MKNSLMTERQQELRTEGFWQLTGTAASKAASAVYSATEPNTLRDVRLNGKRYSATIEGFTAVIAAEGDDWYAKGDWVRNLMTGRSR